MDGTRNWYQDGMHLPYRGYAKAFNETHSCVCGTSVCIEITTAFKSLGDVRGTYCRTPSWNPQAKQTPSVLSKMKKLDLYRRHLAVPFANVASIDNRNRQKNAPSQTRDQAKQTARQYRYVAWHHFHPAAIHKYALTQNRLCIKDYVDADFVKTIIQADGSANGYEESDRFDKDRYYFVPSYSASNAKDDVEKVKRTKQLEGIISELPQWAMQRKAIAERQNVLSSLEQRNKDLEEALRLLKMQQDQQSNIVQVNDAIDVLSLGVSRITVQCDDYHNRYKRASSEFFRFNSWPYTKEFVMAMFPGIIWKQPTLKMIGTPLSSFEECLMTLFYIESNHDLQFLAQVYGFQDHSMISRIINAWLPEWGMLGRHLSILPYIDAQLIDDLEPQSYVDLDLRKVGAILDGKDFYCDTVRDDRTISTAQQGNKLGKSSIRILTWSLPCGLNTEHTDSFFARPTEKRLNYIWASNGRLKNIPVGYLVMADKGFDGTSGYYPNNNTVLHPAFLHGNSQFSPEQIGYNLRACQLRYSCETVYSNVTNCPRLYGFVPRGIFHHFQDLCHWGHGRANLYLPLQMPLNYKDYFASCPRFYKNESRKRKRNKE